MFRGNIESLTGLRFIAAFYVFIFHIAIRWPLFETDGFLKRFVSQGATGMSVFFILSGFLLAYGYAGESSGVRKYVVSRVARIYPVYLLAAVLTLPWFGIAFDTSGLEPALVSAGKIAALVLANIFLLQAWYPDAFPLWNDSASWSISVEAFCYLMLPILLPWLGRRSAKELAVFFALCYLIALAPGQYVRFFPVERFAAVYAMPIFRLPEFLMGVCALLAMRRGLRPIKPSIVALCMVALFVLYLGTYGLQFPMYVGHNWAVLPIITVLIFSLAEAKGPVYWFLSSRVLVWLGKVSYCFYSFQVVVLFLLVQYHSALVGAIPCLGNAWILAVFAFIILLCISSAGYYFVEEPCRRIILVRLSRFDTEATVLSTQKA